MRDLDETDLERRGMSCANPSQTIADALDDVAGVSEATIDFATDEGVVEYDPARWPPRSNQNWYGGCHLTEAHARATRRDGVGGMNRRRADLAVGLFVVLVLLVGGALSWQAYLQQQALGGMMGSMMGGSAGTLHGPNPLWYGLGALVVAVAIGGLYLGVRDDLPVPGARGRRATEVPGADGPDATGAPSEDGTPPVREASLDAPKRRVLDLLPDDERRVLEPVVTSPGITQIELRDRSDFSKSKVSQTVSALEKRGLLYRERQGRTYRVYPSDELRERQ